MITGLAAAWVLKLPLLQGLLVGSIVGSTDAAAVFSVLRSSGLKLPERLTSTLEVESGSNDPMAIFLTLGLIGVITGTADSPQALLWLFVGQFGVGTLAGLLTGRLATWSINRINLGYPGLYPLLALAFGLVARPLAVWASALPFHFRRRELTFWQGCPRAVRSLTLCSSWCCSQPSPRAGRCRWWPAG